MKKKVVCLHEEDAGMLWKHTETRTAHCEQRRGRRLVLSSICTLGNYVRGLTKTMHDLTETVQGLD